MQRTVDCSAPASGGVRSSLRPTPSARRLSASNKLAERAARAPRRAARRAAVAAEAAAAPAGAAAAAPGKEEFYEVYLSKPIGVKFGRGRDGGAYVSRVDGRLGATDARIEVGDKVVKVSASFGADVWDALNFGQVVYAIKTRNGEVYLKLRRSFGDVTALEPEELTDEERQFRAERAGGNYGGGTREMQERNYQTRREAEVARRELFDAALVKFKAGKIEDALIDFENVIALEPKNFVGDDFSRVTQVFRVTQYNIACCYATLEQEDAGLEALDAALAAGFEGYAKVRSDPNLAFIRKSKRFAPLINKYDEPIINEAAIKALKGLFSFGRKADDDDM